MLAVRERTEGLPLATAAKTPSTVTAASPSVAMNWSTGVRVATIPGCGEEMVTTGATVSRSTAAVVCALAVPSSSYATASRRFTPSRGSGIS